MLPVEEAVAGGFGKVRDRDGSGETGLSGRLQVGDGAGKFDDTGAGARRQSHARHHFFQVVLTASIQRTIVPEHTVVHLGVDPYRLVPETLRLYFAGDRHTGSHLIGSL